VLNVVEPAPIDRHRARTKVVVGTHFAVDYIAFVLVALMPLFTARLGLSGTEKATLFAIGSIGSGAIQPFVALWSDRADSRLLGILGLALAGMSVSLFGVATSFEQLLLLQGLATIGVGAFHPVAAAAIGRLSGRRRSLGVAAFFLAGMLGGVAGNTTSPLLVGWWGATFGAAGGEASAGLQALGLVGLVGLAGAAALLWGIRRVSHKSDEAHERHRSLASRDRRLRWTAVGLLYVGNVLRFVVNMALVFLFEKWAEVRTLAQADAVALTNELGLRASTLNGPLQGAMQLGMGVCGIAAGAVLRSRHEKAALVGVPLFGAIAIGLFPWASQLGGSWAVVGALGVSVLAGMGFGGMIPVTITLAQRLLPHRTGLASGLMMGGAWSFGAGGPFIAAWASRGLGLDGAFLAVGGLLASAGVLALALPGRVVRESADS